MKKILSIALVALLATSAVFAGFTGSATVGFGYNLDDASYGFNNSTKSTVTFSLTNGVYPVPVEASEEEAEEAEEAPAPSIKAGIDASFTLELKKYEANKEGDPAWKINPSVSAAYVEGENWKVSILGSMGAEDYAVSPFDKYVEDEETKKTTVKAEVAAAPGVKVEYNGWTIAGGLKASTAKSIVASKNYTNPELKDYVEEYDYWYYEGDFVAGKTAIKELNDATAKEWKAFVKAQKEAKVDITLVKNELQQYVKVDAKGDRASGSMSIEDYERKFYSISYKPSDPVEYKVIDYSAYVATPVFAFGPVKVNAAAFIADDSNKADDETAPSAYLGLSNLGISTKVAYEGAFAKASVASDFVFSNIGKDSKAIFNFDAYAKAEFAPVYVTPEVEEGEEPAEPKLDHYIGAVELYYAKDAKAETILATNSKLENATVVKNLISAKASAKLDSFVGMPLTVAVTGRDILTAKVYGIEASATVNAITAGLKAEYGFVNADYAFTGNVSYAADMFTAKASATYLSSKQFYASASVESAKIIPGATLSLAYNPAKEDGKYTTNLLKKFGGSIDATCTIAF